MGVALARSVLLPPAVVQRREAVNADVGHSHADDTRRRKLCGGGADRRIRNSEPIFGDFSTSSFFSLVPIANFSTPSGRKQTRLTEMAVTHSPRNVIGKRK